MTTDYTEQIQNFVINSIQLINIQLQKLTGQNSITISNVYPLSFEPAFQKSNNPHIDSSDNLFDALGKLYESTLPKNLRKDLGQFYTRDDSLITQMISDSELFKGLILEPSCGSGLFMVHIANRIIAIMKKEGNTSEEILTYIQKNLYGNDNDLLALQITEINLLTTLLPLIADALNTNPFFKLNKLNLTSFDFTQRDVFSKKFSLVIGNPPFITMYGKRSRNMTEEKRAYFNTFDFVQNKNGNNKFNISMFFVENGLKQLEPNGQIIFILDIAFFETAYIDLRKYIIENYYINSITKGLQAFEDVASGQIIINISNRKESNDSVIFKDIENNISCQINQAIWDDSKNKYKIFIPLVHQAKDINDKVMKYPRLDTYYPGKALRTCCALTGKTEEFVVNPLIEKKHLVFPYIEGSKGLKCKFGELTPTRHIKYDYELQLAISEEFKKELELAGVKNKKRVTLGDKDAYSSPKIFIRQSAKEIIATYTEDPFAANNSIYVLSNKSNAKQDTDMLKYVCGILNSELITYFCRINKIIRVEKGKTPQIKTSDLKEIRICISDEYYYPIIDFVEKLLECQNSTYYNTLNNYIYSIYNITTDEQKFIKTYLYT